MKTLKYLTANEKNALTELVSILKDKYKQQLKEIKLFGSKIRGDFNEASDVDVFIVFNNNVDWKFKEKIYDLIFDIDLKYDVYISARVYSVQSLNITNIRELPFIKNVVEHGVDLI